MRNYLKDLVLMLKISSTIPCDSAGFISIKAIATKFGPSEDRWKDRSRAYPGIAEAMAAQWSFLPPIR